MALPKDVYQREVEKFEDLGTGKTGVAVVIYAEAVDGPDAGSMVAIKAQYNSSTGNYELLTAGSGTTPTVSYNILTESGDGLLTESGDNLVLESAT